MTGALEFLLLGLVHGSGVAAVVWALDAMLRKRISPALSCALWTIALAKFLVPVGPALNFRLGPVLARGPSAFLAPLELHGGAGKTVLGSTWPAILFAAWLLVVAVLAATRIITARRLATSINSLPLASPVLIASVGEAASALGLRRVPGVRTGAGPFIAGCWRPTLVVPFERAETDEDRAMLLHELAHLRRRDPWMRVLQNLAQIFFFFWPPVRWINRKIEQHRELACDQLALEHSALAPAAYARMLLAAQRGAVPSPWQLAVLEMASKASRLERRIDMVLKMNGPRSLKWTALAMISGALLALSGTALALDAGSARSTGPADESPIQDVVRRHRTEIGACYEAALLTNPGLEGRLVFDWSITPTGAVGEGCVTSSEFRSDLSSTFSAQEEDELWHCVSAAVHAWKFPPPKGGQKVDVSYPFVFKQAAVPFIAEPEAP